MTSGWIIEGIETRIDGFQLGPVDLCIPTGTTVAVLGASGAGKTTFLRTLAGFLPPRRGRILHDGVDITQWPAEERGLGYVPQGLGLLPHRTVSGNIRYPMEVRGRPDADRRTTELVERFRLGPIARRYPARLSGGEQQRVALARALAADPGLIVWDEPWQGLDVLARDELGVVLHDLRETEPVPVLVVSHDPALAFSVADRFLVLDRGSVRASCDANTLLGAPIDPFTARFVGFDNVFDAPALVGDPSGPFRTWLVERAGHRGVAFPAPLLPSPPGNPSDWEGAVRSVRPGPHGLTVEVVVEGLWVTLRTPPPWTPPLPAPGATIRFGIDPVSVRPLGGPVGPPMGT